MSMASEKDTLPKCTFLHWRWAWSMALVLRVSILMASVCWVGDSDTPTDVDRSRLNCRAGRACFITLALYIFRHFFTVGG